VAQQQRKAAAPSGSNLKTFYWILGLVGLLSVAGIAWVTLKGAKAAQQPIELAPEAIANAQDLVKAARGIKEGSDAAPIRILVFSDYMCPACRQFTTAVEPGLRRDFIETGKVQLVYHDFPLGGAHKWSFLAARAGRCAEDQSKFWPYHDLLFARQSDWSFSQTAPTGKFEDYAREVGLDQKAFEACLNSNKHQELVTANHTLGVQLGVSGTPTLFMNGRQLAREWSDYSLLKTRLEQELGPSAAASTTAGQRLPPPQ
jgi:protein-disulfide isomerase